MNKSKIGRVSCALWLALAMGCGDSAKKKDTPAGDGGLVSEEGGVADPAALAKVRDALAPLADAQCAWLFSCCKEDERSADLGPAVKDAETCSKLLLDRVARGLDYFYFQHLQRGLPAALAQLDRLGYQIDQGRVSVDEDAVKACAAQLEKADCQKPAADHCAAEKVIAPDEDPCDIRKLLVGRQKAGQSCEPYAADVDCAKGLRCANASNSKGVCVAMALEKESCLDGTECARGLRCDPVQGICTKGLAAGAKCSFDDPEHPVPGTEKTPCALGLVCDAASLKCTDERCAVGISCYEDAACPDGSTCVRNRCGPLAKSGELCYQNDDCENERCSYDALLAVQRCAPERKDGAVCASNQECESGFCSGASEPSVCKPRQAASMPCTEGAECKLGVCDFTLESPACKALGVEGDACEAMADCAYYDGFECRGLTCHRAPFALGVACGYNEECASNACAGGECVMPGKSGDACSAGGDLPPCAAGSFCKVDDAATGQGVCEEKRSYGSPCAFDYECTGSCRPLNGMLRCDGVSRADPSCTGAK